jgi:hypothetical protein
MIPSQVLGFVCKYYVILGISCGLTQLILDLDLNLDLITMVRVHYLYTHFDISTSFHKQPSKSSLGGLRI